MTYKCPTCGNMIESGTNPCPSCGQVFNWPTSEAAQTTAITQPAAYQQAGQQGAVYGQAANNGSEIDFNSNTFLIVTIVCYVLFLFTFWFTFGLTLLVPFIMGIVRWTKFKDNMPADGTFNTREHVLQCLVNPIYLYWWIYRTTKYFNEHYTDYQKDPTGELLLNLFFPSIYTIFWAKKVGECLQRTSYEKGIEDDIKIPAAILGYFGSVFGTAIYVQLMINKLVPAEQAGEPVNPNRVPGPVNIWLHVFLVLEATIIYAFYWIYKTTKYLAQELPAVETRTPTTELLLCIFIPFYNIYWSYVTATRIAALAAQRGRQEDLTVPTILFAIFTSLWGVEIFLQARLNDILKSTPATTNAYAYTYAYTTQNPVGTQTPETQNVVYDPNSYKN